MSTSVSALSSSAITSQLTAYEARLQAPITVLQNQEAADKTEISAWGSISGAMSTLQSALSNISDVSNLNYRSATSSQTSVATASATTGAAAGDYSLSNVVLAKSQEIYSGLIASGASGTLSGGAGTLTFNLSNGKSETVSIGSGSLSLTDVAKAVNSANGPVKASIVNSTAGARLVLTGSATGSSQAFTVAGTGALSRFSYSTSTPGSEVEAVTATNATLTMNGVPINSATNTLSSAIGGVTIKLTGSGSTTVSVSSSPTSLSTAVNTVASDLEKALSAISTATKYVASGSTASASASASSKAPTSGPLLGNFTATDLRNQLLSAVSGAAASGATSNTIGLKVSSSGTVSFDSTTFAAAFASNPTGVQKLVSNIYTSLNNLTTGAVGAATDSTSGTSTSTSTSKTGSGTIGAEITSLNASVTSLGSSITSQTKLAKVEIQNLVNEYSLAESESSVQSIDAQYLSLLTSSGTKA